MYDIDLINSEFELGRELVLAERDISDIFILPQKLYGRDKEFDELVKVYDRIESSSSFELVFVQGQSGMGKTSLVLELNKHVMQHGIFIHGKCNCFNLEPYFVFIEAVKMFCDTIALEDKATRDKYRDLIQGAVGEEGKLLTNVISNLETIIGKQRNIYESFGSEAKNRFTYVFVKFLKAIASVNSTFTIVLEDLQWADLASIELIKALAESSIKNVMLIGVYRDNEVQEKREIVNFLHEVKTMNISVTEIKLNNMDHESLNSYVSDSLRTSPFLSYALTVFLYKKTNGNPFYVKQIINCLLDQKIIQFSLEKNEWKWNKSILDDNDLVANIIDLLKQRIQSLSNQAQHVLKIASFLKSPFSISTLVLIVDDGKGVEDALASGILTQHKGCDTCCFVHDQFKYAASCLLPEDRKQMYLSVARKLLQLRSTVDLEDNIADITKLYYAAKDMLEDNERFEVATLFQLAGEKALVSTAFDEASNYFESGIEMLGIDGWKSRYSFYHSIYCNAAKSAYCKADYNRMNYFNEVISVHVTSSLDLMTSHIVKIRMHIDKKMFEEALTCALSILDRLDEQIDFNETRLNYEIKETTKLVAECLNSIPTMRKMEDMEQISIMQVLCCVAYAAFVVQNPAVLDSIALRMVQLSLKNGISKYSCLGFSAFAVILCRRRNRLSYDVGILSQRLSQQTNAKDLIAQVNIAVLTNVMPSATPIRNILSSLRKTAVTSLESGLHHYSTSTFAVYCSFSFYCGENLPTLLDEMNKIGDLLKSRSKQFMAINQAILNLQDINADNPSILSGNEFNFERCFDSDSWEHDVAYASTICCVVAYLFDDVQMASKMIERCKALVYGNVIKKLLFHFYDGLIASMVSEKFQEKERFMKNIAENIEKLESYAENVPENFSNKVRRNTVTYHMHKKQVFLQINSLLFQLQRCIY